MMRAHVSAIVNGLVDYMVASITAILYGWVDESGNFIVDENGNHIVFTGE